MGVPAFFRWLSEKYPRTIMDVIEQRAQYVDGTRVPIDLTQPNPNAMEFDHLYIDMNGIIHPCSHPEDRPPPKSEEEMFHNVMMYVDRIFAAVRPRKLLFLAIDGVAPRAKMNQQRTRRFRSAADAKERHDIKQQTRREMMELGLPVPPEELDKEWDSNVITPGTPFMTKLAHYLRYYVAERVNNNRAWRQVKIIFSDGSEPGEGEHKIMDFIRRQRAQPGYDPNTRHILHGLDADLIMLALASHEPHFTILREQVLFGRRAKEEPRKSAAQESYEAMTGNMLDESEYNSFPFLKPFQMLHIPVLREYLEEEFRVTRAVAFGYDFERVIDDFVFLCFFVGNDFLPHLPSLDIRDGALDFLINVYKRVLPSLGGYLTNSGGEVNLERVDVVLSEVGRVEDEIFRRRHMAEQRERERFERNVRRVERTYGGSAQELGQRIVTSDVKPLGAAGGQGGGGGPPGPLPRSESSGGNSSTVGSAASDCSSSKNMEVAKALRESLRKRKKTAGSDDEQKELPSQAPATAAAEEANGGEANSQVEEDVTSPSKKLKAEEEAGASVLQVKTEVLVTATITQMETETDALGNTQAQLELNGAEAAQPLASSEDGVIPVPVLERAESSGTYEEDDGTLLKDEETEDPITVPTVVPPELVGTELAEAQRTLAFLVKSKHEAKLDRLREEIEDAIKLHEAGFKDRYYHSKLKKQNVEAGGGREHMVRSYIEGLCWVYQYYYRGCPSWHWYYPFHYAPFASDLMNIDRIKIHFDLGTPFHPIEQLMAVLPPESADALPLPFARLMTSPESPIKDFYPSEVEVDPNGKHLPWLWVTLLPFIDEKRLLGAMQAVEGQLSAEERERNSFGPSLLYVYVDHPVASAVQTLLHSAPSDMKDDVKADGTQPLSLMAASYEGFSGVLLVPPAKARLKLGDVILAPPQPPHTFTDIEENKALAACYKLPPYAPHQSFLLPGITLPAPRLTPRDLAPRRPPRLGKGGLNIADLGTQFGYSGDPAQQQQQQQQQAFLAQHVAQRMIMHGTGLNMGAFMASRGGPPRHQQPQQPPYGMGMLLPPPQPHPSAVGVRGWGSLEPQFKHQHPPPPSLYPRLPPPAPLMPPGMPPPRPPPGPPPPRPYHHHHQYHHMRAPLFAPVHAPPLVPLGAHNQGLLDSLRQQVASTLQQRSTGGRGGPLIPPGGSAGQSRNQK